MAEKTTKSLTHGVEVVKFTNPSGDEKYFLEITEPLWNISDLDFLREHINKAEEIMKAGF